MLPFDVILFDVGGVLLTNGWDHQERALTMEHFHLDLASFEARHAAVDGAWERGLITGKDYLNATIFNEPRDFSRGAFFSFMLSLSQPLPNGALGILKELAAGNQYMLGALNNEARETNEYRFREFNLRSYFKVALSSCYLGLYKPDLAIFRRALDLVCAPADRILFIDDRPANVAGAAAAGIKAVQFTGESALREQLKELGVF
jgi:putative hydrolase of the HAD superfamily